MEILDIRLNKSTIIKLISTSWKGATFKGK